MIKREARQGLRDAMTAYRQPYAKGDLRESFDILDEAIRRFNESHGDGRELVKPLALSAELVHRLGEIEQAHARLERIVAIATAYSAPGSRFFADAFCLAGIAEESAECARAIDFYERGINEGAEAGLDSKWMIQNLTALVQTLLKFRPHSPATLAYAWRAEELAAHAGIPSGSLIFVTRFNLGRAQLEAGMNVDAAETFEALISARKARAGAQETIDRRVE
jgi:tetratricopeptide (TPR) repeat protein